MRPIHVAEVGGKLRPVVVLTREAVRPRLINVTIAPITSRVRGITTEVPVGPANGIDHDSVISCDNIVTIPTDRLKQFIGHLLDDQEAALAEAIIEAFNLDV